MKKLIFQILASILGIYLAVKFIPGVQIMVISGVSEIFGFKITADWQILTSLGIILGLINFFIKPVLKMITLPLRILTFGLFSLVINMVMVWTVDILFHELVIQGIIPLFWTTVIIWGVSLLLGLYQPRRRIVVEE